MREFLKGLELDKEVIESIMVEHGKRITEAKSVSNNYEEKIKEYEDKIETYESKIKEYENEISNNSKKIENLQELTKENNDLKAQIQMDGSKVKKEFSKFVRSEVMANVNDDMDFATALKNYKEENPQYFGDTVVKKVQSSPTLTGGSQPQTTNEIMNNILRGNKE